jgi:hypothetical protein
MTSTNVKEFLDFGLMDGANLYLHGYSYWCEGYYRKDKDKPMHVFVYKYPSVVVHQIYTKRLSNKQHEFKTVFDVWASSKEEATEKFLQAKIFDGKTFQEVENEIAWYDEID